MSVDPQEITIELTEKQTRLSVESLSIVMDSLVKLLRSVDSRMWQVGAPRYRWIIKSVQMNSPLTMTIEAVQTNEDAPSVDVVGSTFRGLGQLDGGRARTPKFFDDESLALAKRMVSVYSDGVLAMSLRSPKKTEINPSSRIAGAVERIAARAKPDPFEAYGSIEGVLRRVTVDDRPDHEVSELQIIDRFTDQLVECRVTPETAEQLTQHIRHRVVLYGTVKYSGAHIPSRINVDSFERIDSAAIPSLEDIQNMNINFTDGEDAADYISRLRGND